MTAVDRKIYWDLLETLEWICTRAEGVGVVTCLNDENTVARAMFSWKAILDLPSLPLVTERNGEADRGLAASQRDRQSPGTDEAATIASSETLNYLLRQVQIRRIRMTAVRCDRNRLKQLLLPPAELNDLEFRITPGYRVANVGLWSRSRNTLLWKSPQFLRADIARVWPAPKKRTAAVSDAILHHLQAIISFAFPLTKAEAQRRCLAEVPNASIAAFNKAWALLDPACKRGRGQHGTRGALNLETSEQRMAPEIASRRSQISGLGMPKSHRLLSR